MVIHGVTAQQRFSLRIFAVFSLNLRKVEGADVMDEPIKDNVGQMSQTTRNGASVNWRGIS